MIQLDIVIDCSIMEPSACGKLPSLKFLFGIEVRLKLSVVNLGNTESSRHGTIRTVLMTTRHPEPRTTTGTRTTADNKRCPSRHSHRPECLPTRHTLRNI